MPLPTQEENVHRLRIRQRMHPGICASGKGCEGCLTAHAAGVGADAIEENEKLKQALAAETEALRTAIAFIRKRALGGDQSAKSTLKVIERGR